MLKTRGVGGVLCGKRKNVLKTANTKTTQKREKRHSKLTNVLQSEAKTHLSEKLGQNEKA